MQKTTPLSPFQLAYGIEPPNVSNDFIERDIVAQINQLYINNQQPNLELEETKKNYLEISWRYLILADHLKADSEKAQICWKEGLEALTKFHRAETNKRLDHQTWLGISSYYLLRTQQPWNDTSSVTYHHLRKSANALTKALKIQYSSEARQHKSQLAEYLKIFWKEQKPFLNHTSYLTDEDAFGSDIYQPGLITINTPEIYEGISPLFTAEKDSEEYRKAIDFMLKQTSSKDRLRFHSQICKSHANDPALLIQILNDYQDVPLIERLRLEEQARNQLACSAEEELKKAGNYNKRVVTNQKQWDEKIEQLAIVAAHFREKAELSKTELKKQLSIWRENKNNFLPNLSRFFKGEIEEAHLWSSFENLRHLNPLAIDPFLPFLALSNLFSLDSLRTLLEEASACDPYITYAISTLSARIYPSQDRLPSLEALQELHPKDIYLKALRKGLETDAKEIDLPFDKVGMALSCSLLEIASGNLDDAIQTLVNMKPYVFGFSIIYEYLAIAWSLKGDMEKASSFIKRASFLMNPDTISPPTLIFPLTQIMTQITPQESPKKPLSKPAVVPSLLSEFTNLLKDSFETHQVRSFIKKCAASLKNSKIEELPVIYFAITWLSSKLSLTKEGLKEDKNLWKKLFKLTTHTAEIHYKFTNGQLDSWVAEKYIRKMNKNGTAFRYTVSFSEITFGYLQNEEFPRFEFNGLKLSSASIASIALSLTKKIHHLAMGLATSHLIPEFTFNHPAELLPDSPTLFLTMLRAGFNPMMKETPQHEQAIQLLMNYSAKNDSTRPYQIDQDILDWAFLCKNSDEIPSNEQITSLKDNLPKQLFDSHAKQALRDVSLASEAICNRAGPTSVIKIPTDGSSFYEVFLLGQRLFGWKEEESFAAWGERLNQFVDRGLFAADHHRFNHDVNSLPTIEIPSQTDHVLYVIKNLLLFWQEFHQETTAKNQFIANDGDEDMSSRRLTNWHQNLAPNLWEQIIQNNTPQNHPLYLKNKKAITDLVAKKHKHVVEVQELRNVYERRQNKQAISQIDFDKLSSALLLAKAEGQRAQDSPNLYLADQAEAERVYRIALEATVRRSVEAALIVAGPDEWAVRNGEKTLDLLKKILKPCIGKFHGPEIHRAGEAPLQIHYNANVYTSKGGFANTHIFFGN